MHPVLLLDLKLFMLCDKSPGVTFPIYITTHKADAGDPNIKKILVDSGTYTLFILTDSIVVTSSHILVSFYSMQRCDIGLPNHRFIKVTANGL